MEKKFVPVARVGDLQPGQIALVWPEGQRVALANVGGQYYAVDTACSHLGASLAKGRLEGSIVECPWHGSRFDLASGKPLNPPAISPVRVYEVRLVGDVIEVGILE